MRQLKFIFLLLILCTFPYCLHAQLKGYYKTGEKRFEIDTANGMLNGKFRLWLKNGKKTFEGSFKNNQKHGTWTIWDTLGRVRVKYKFKGNSNYSFKITTFNNSEGKPMKRLGSAAFLQQRYLDSIAKSKRDLFWYNMPADAPKDSLLPMEERHKKYARNTPRVSYGYENYTETSDSTGLILYPYVRDRDVFTSIKMYRFVAPSTLNEPLFNSAIIKLISDYTHGKISPEIYSSSYFTKRITPDDALEKLKQLQGISAYKIMELWYFDKNTMSSSTRILGICPVVFNKALQKYDDVLWLYYPDFRKELAKTRQHIKGKPEIHTLEDILHHRQFSSFVYFREHATQKEEDVDIYKNIEKLRQESTEMEALPLIDEYYIMLYFTENR